MQYVPRSWIFSSVHNWIPSACMQNTYESFGFQSNFKVYPWQIFNRSYYLQFLISIWFNGVVVITPVLHSVYTGGRRFDPGFDQSGLTFCCSSGKHGKARVCLRLRMRYIPTFSFSNSRCAQRFSIYEDRLKRSDDRGFALCHSVKMKCS